jgi:hypothetical protein
MWIAEGLKTGDGFREDGGERGKLGEIVVVAEKDDYIIIVIDGNGAWKQLKLVPLFTSALIAIMGDL